MVEGHILKFLSKQQPQTLTSRRVFPQQKNGYSKQSPQWFRRKFSLQSQRGYEYKNDQPHIKEKFNYLSQRNQFNINKQYDKNTQQTKMLVNPVHNLKKGLLSEYLDNNSWMKQTVPLTGFERGPVQRRLNHKDRQKKIQAAQLKNSSYIAAKTASNFYSTKRSNSVWNKTRTDLQSSQLNKESFLKNPQNLHIVGDNITKDPRSRSKSISALMGQKQHIRSQRNELALNKIYKIQKFKLAQTLNDNKLRTIDSQFVQQRMAMTAREWAGRKSSPQKSIQRFNQMIGQNQKRKRFSSRGSIVDRQKGTVQYEQNYSPFEQNNYLSQQL